MDSASSMVLAIGGRVAAAPARPPACALRAGGVGLKGGTSAGGSAAAAVVLPASAMSCDEKEKTPLAEDTTELESEEDSHVSCEAPGLAGPDEDEVKPSAYCSSGLTPAAAVRASARQYTH